MVWLEWLKKTPKDSINKANQQSQYTLITSLDVQGAFDAVRHQTLLEHCVSLNLPTYYISFLDHWLKNRHFRIKITNKHAHYFSKSRRLQVGLPQGGILSPCKWNSLTYLMVPNILKEINNLKLTTQIHFFSFADDTTYILTNPNLNTLINDSHIISQIVMNEYK